uniref:Uncharacterized protein n=1 Tax=Pseudo-nitzschia australis TaxID=44445 RepID=A0A7S4AJR2_9STRA|mmetsp:Transcript_2369/g.5113  ORF Transcript_2369/g.5113 Transcript_2369/m.5113 type:complete len:351 (+) Transcript_2369:198-1250(+)
MEAFRTRQIAYALVSFLVGVWAFITVNAISGPAFEPIIAACSNPDIPIEEFAAKTGYHDYEPRVGLKVFNLLVCLITQFLLELRETPPAGVLVWAGVVVVSLPCCVIANVEAGRAGARGPIRYPVVMALLFQLFGISVVFPLVWLPGFVFGEGRRGSPVTLFRVVMGALFSIPGTVLTLIVFLAPTESRLWTTAAGILGGPMLALTGLVLFTDKSSEITATEENTKASSRAIQTVYKLLMAIGFVGWYVLVGIAYRSYGIAIGDLWKDIWVEAGPSVAFMTIDTGVLYLALVIFVAYRSDEFKAAKALLLTTVLGPATAVIVVLMEIENETEYDFDAVDSQKSDELKKVE